MTEASEILSRSWTCLASLQHLGLPSPLLFLQLPIMSHLGSRFPPKTLGYKPKPFAKQSWKDKVQNGAGKITS